MKVLHVFDHTLPVSDGYATRSRKVLQALSGTGITPIALTSPKQEQYARGPVAGEEWIDAIRHVRTGRVAPSRWPGLTEIRMMRALHRRIMAVARASGVSLIHAHSPVLNALPALAVGRRLGIPVVYEIRAFWEDAAVDQGTHREWGPRYRTIRTLETLACRQADAVVTICNGLKKDLIGRGISPDKITVVPNAIDPEEFRPQPPNPDLRVRWGFSRADFLLGFIGSFYHYEGLDVLLGALARLNGVLNPDKPPESAPTTGATLGREVKLLLVGGGEEENRLKQLTATLGLGARVVFTGRLPHEEIPQVYAVLDALVLPRKSIRLTELVTPLKPLEAMAMGVPIIASDVGGHQELIRDGETGLLFPASHVDSLAQQILRLAREHSTSSKFSETALSWLLKERTWSKNAQRYRAVYEHLLETGVASAAGRKARTAIFPN